MEVEKRNQALKAIAKDPNRLVKTNPIINAKFDITAVQMKVILKVIASIDQSLETMPEVNISIKEFQSFIGGKAKNIYSYLQEELSKLRKKDIFYEDDRIKLEASFFSSIIYHKHEGYFTFELSKNIKPFLLQIKENFTILDIRNVMHLNSIYAIRFYEFCKEFERLKTFEFEVDDLKERFGLSKRYKNYYDFKLKVLIQARDELIENSELYFDFEEKKSGKKVVRLKFNIIKKPKSVLQLAEYNIKEDNPEISNIIGFVKDYVNEETVLKWFEKYSFEQIKRGVEYSLDNYNKGKVKDMAGYLQKMVGTTILPSYEEKNKEAQIKKKAQSKLITELKQAELAINLSRKSFQEQYFNAKKILSVEILTKNEELYLDIFKKLCQENERDFKSLLSELALANYKITQDNGRTNLSEFIDNFNHGGSFTSYVIDFLQVTHKNDFDFLRSKMLPLAYQVGLVELDLF